MIASGVSARVFKAVYQGATVAVKVMDNPEIEQEILLSSWLQHPNLIEFVGVAITNKLVAMITKFAERGSLTELLHSEQEIVWYTRLHFSFQIAAAMEFLHSLKLIHRDLKSGNVLITQDWDTKLCDYGTSRVISSKMTQSIGTCSWIAPEGLDISDAPLSNTS